MTGEQITELRTRRGMTQTAFAELLGVSQGTVSDWERNIKSPRRSTMLALRKLAKRRRNGKVK